MNQSGETFFFNEIMSCSRDLFCHTGEVKLPPQLCFILYILCLSFKNYISEEVSQCTIS